MKFLLRLLSYLSNMRYEASFDYVHMSNERKTMIYKEQNNG